MHPQISRAARWILHKLLFCVVRYKLSGSTLIIAVFLDQGFLIQKWDDIRRLIPDIVVIYLGMSASFR